MARICEVGSAKKGINSYLISKGAIDKSNKIVSRPKLAIEHNFLKRRLKERFGVERDVILEDSTSEYITYNDDAIGMIDAFYGHNYPGNRQYWRDYMDDSTLNPEQMVAKYVTTTKSPVGIAIKSADFTLEGANKMVVGLRNIYPEIETKIKEEAVVQNQQRYSIELSARPTNQPVPTSDDSPLSSNQEYFLKNKIVVTELMQPLLSKFKNVQVEWVTVSELDQKLLYDYKAKPVVVRGGRVAAVAIGNKVYLAEGRVDANIALEELMHFFVDSLITKKPALFKGLVNQAETDYPALAVQVAIDYSDANGFNQEYRNVELVTRALRNAYIQERVTRPEGVPQNEFLKVAQRFFKWLIDQLKSIFNIEDLPLTTTISQLAVFLNTKDFEIQMGEVLEPRYNIEMDPYTDDLDADSIPGEVKDEKTLKEIKLENLNTQTKILAKAKAIARTRKNPQMMATIDKLIKVTKDYEAIIKKDEKTVSTTKFIGQPILPEEVKEKVQSSQDYGQFIHGFMEEIMLESLYTNQSPAYIFANNPSLFDNFYENNKDYLSLNGLSKDDEGTKDIVKEDLVDIVSSINEYYLTGNLVLPELIVYGTDDKNGKVLSRLDFVVVKTDGKVSIGDFKTTQLKGPTKFYQDKTLYVTYRNKELQNGVHPSFLNFPGRSKASGFLSQVGVYERSLMQHGIESEDNVIVNIVYAPNEDFEDWTYENLFVRKINLKGKDGLAFERDENGKPTLTYSRNYEKVLRALSKSIPLPEEDTTEETLENEVSAINKAISALPEAKVKILLDNARAKIAQQLDTIGKEFRIAEEKRADRQKLEQLKQRRRMLAEAKGYLDNQSTIPDALVLAGAMERIFQLINATVTDAQRIETDEKNVKLRLEKLSIKNQQLNDYINFLSTFKSIIQNSEVKDTDTLIKMISDNILEAEKGQKPYLKEARNKFIEVLMAVPKRNADLMLQSMRQLLEPRAAKLQKIINGDVSIFNKGGFWLSGKIKSVINSITGTTPTTITTDMKEAAREELNKINYFLKFPEYTKEFVELYVDNTFTNPESGFYIGSTINTGYGGLTMDDFRSSFGNSELAITAIANYGISMTDAAQQNFWDQMEKLQIDQRVKTLQGRYGGYQGLNNVISEVVSMIDLKTGEKESYMSYVGPILRSYFDKHDELDYAMFKLTEQIDAIKADTKLSKEDRDVKIKDLAAQKKVKRKELQDWLLKESVTKLMPEVYELQIQLPDDIQDQIEQIEKKIADLKGKAANGEWEISNSLLDEIQQHEFDIAALRKKAIKEDPNIEETFRKIDKYFVPTINYGLYEYVKRQMLNKYGEDSPEMNRWYELNSEMVPTDEWYDAVNQIYADMKKISTSNVYLDGLYNRRKEIIAKYRFKSEYSAKTVFNPNYLSDEDATELDKIEDDITAYFEDENNRGGSPNGKKYRELKSKLSRLQQETSKPKFSTDFDEKYNELLRLITDINETTDDTRKSDLEKEFVKKEIEFKRWYDRNNNKEYILGTIKAGDTVSPIPKRFNVIKVPSDPAYMKREPSYRYRTRHYSEAAYNPEYSPTLEKRRYGKGSYPMPKGIKYNNETKRFEVDKNAKYVNKKYLDIMADSTLKQFYESLVMDEYYNKQVHMSASKLGFFYPSVRQEAFESIASDGVKGMRREWNELKDEIMFRRSDFEQADNEYGVAGQNRIKFAFNYAPPGKPALPESLVTKDGINAIIKWRLQYEINQKMEEANLAMSPMIDFLKTNLSQIPKDQTLVRQQVSKVIEIFEFERNKFIYGQTVNTTGKENEFLNQRTMRMFLTAASWARLAFDPAMQAGNLISGNVQAFLASNMKNYGRGTTEDYLWAKGQIYNYGGFLYKLVENWGDVSGVNLETKILRYFNTTMKTMERNLDVTSRGKVRRLLNRAFNIKDLAFIIQDKGEVEIALTTLLKNLHAYKFNVYELDQSGNIKVDVDGKPILKLDENGEPVMVNAYEAMEDTGKGTPSIRKDVAMTYQDLEGIKVEVQQEYLRHQGNYSNWTKAPAEAGFIGVLMFFFRKYLVPFLEVRFKGAFGIGDPKNWVSGQAQVGWWTAFWGSVGNYGPLETLKSTLPGFVLDRVGGSKIPLETRNRIFQARNETLASVVGLLAYIAAREMVYPGDDEDDKKLNWAQMQSLRTLAKVTQETRAMVPLPLTGKLEDYVKNFGTFTTAFNEVQTYTRAFEHLLYYMLYNMYETDYFYEQAFYQVRRGRYEAGDAKVIKDLTKMTSIENIQDIINPEFTLKEQYKRKD